MRFNQVTTIICNPAAGEGQALSRWEAFRKKLDERGIPYEVVMTTHPGNATELTRTLDLEHAERLAVFGGDGTFNEVLQGLLEDGQLRYPNLKLIYIPAGSSCDFEKKFPDPTPPLERFEAGRVVHIDIGRIACRTRDGESSIRYFANNSSIGVISQANEKFNSVEGLTRWLKQISVDVGAVLAGIQAIREFEAFPCRITLDGEALPVDTLSNITVFKTPYFGGGMNYGVTTEPDDGIFQVAIVEGVSRWKLAGLIPTLYTGTILKKEAAHLYAGKYVEFETPTPIVIEADGEVAGYPPAQYSILPSCLPVIV
jgi:YegS/Rv2252/BmrU family lipid kinase